MIVGDKMNKVELKLKTIQKSGFAPLKTAKHFNTANLAYHTSEAKKLDKIIDTNFFFIIYMDITKISGSYRIY